VRKMLTMPVALLVTVGALVSARRPGPAPDATVNKVMKAR